MSVYKVKVELVYTAIVEVEADSKEEAKRLVNNGEGEMIASSEKYKEFSGATNDIKKRGE